MSNPKPEPTESNQLSPLPTIQRHITGHNQDGQAIFHSSKPGVWTSLGPSMDFNVIYSTSVPKPCMNNDVDISTHESVMESGKLGLVNPNGSVCRMVDFGPSTEDAHAKPIMHRTQSLDYGIVLEGEIECVLDSGEVRLMKRGDIAVQRGTMHAWRNTSSTEWARMIFVLLAAEKVNAGGKELEADMEGEVPDVVKQQLSGGL
ncbi:MAG: hypothetical protein Q9215_007249 [Flavoplaca cf. flavocitrina]